MQALDTRIDQIAHKVSTLPEHAQVAALEERRDALRGEVVVAQTEQTDVNRELVKAEGDVQLVRDRAERDQRRLESGQGAPRELEALQHELGSLAKRQSDLEDIELEVMERLEAVTARAEHLLEERDGVERELAEVGERRAAALGELSSERESVAGQRSSLAEQLPADVLGLYEKIRASSGGTGAARLHQGRCEGCHIELTPTDLNRIRTAPEDEVLRCEECRRILVRVPESGL